MKLAALMIPLVPALSLFGCAHDPVPRAQWEIDAERSRAKLVSDARSACSQRWLTGTLTWKECLAERGLSSGEYAVDAPPTRQSSSSGASDKTTTKVTSNKVTSKMSGYPRKVADEEGASLAPGTRRARRSKPVAQPERPQRSVNPGRRSS